MRNTAGDHAGVVLDSTAVFFLLITLFGIPTSRSSTNLKATSGGLITLLLTSRFLNIGTRMLAEINGRNANVKTQLLHVAKHLIMLLLGSRWSDRSGLPYPTPFKP